MTKAKKLGTDMSKTPDIKYYKAWRTYQMSDHLPMELDINFSKRYLEDKNEWVGLKMDEGLVSGLLI